MNRVKRAIMADPLLILLTVLWLVRAVSIIQTKNLGASINLLVFYSSMVGFYMLLRQYFDLSLYKIHTLTVTTIVLFGILEVLWALQKTAFPGVLLGGNYLRIPATFYDANHLPAYILTVLPFLLVLVWQANNLFKKSVLAFLLCLSTLLLLGTFSRSGMIGFTVAFFIFFVLLVIFKYYKKALSMAAIALVVVIAGILTSQTEYSLFKRLGSVLNPAEKSTTAHETLLLGEWNLFIEHPILGVGYGSFSEAFRDSDWGKAHLYVDPTQNIRLPAHSIWLETLTETGILGFVPYAALMFLVLLTVSRALRKVEVKSVRLYLSALVSGLVGILAAGMFYSYNLEFFWFYLFFVYLFSVWVINSSEKAVSIDVDIGSDQDQKEKVDWLELGIVLFLVVFSGFILFYKLGERGLLDWDEAIYAGVSKNIIKFKDPLTLRWVDNVYWFEKPPLYMWLSSIMIFFFGVTAFAARFWSAFFGVWGIIVTYFFGKTLFKRKLPAFLAAVMLATTTVYLYYSRNGMLDITFTALSTTGLWLYYSGKENKSRLQSFLSGAFFGLAALSKGFVVIVPLGVVGLFELLSIFESKRRFYSIFRLSRLFTSNLTLIVLGFTLVAAPWHLAMVILHGKNFVDSYFIYHVFKRGTEAIEGKSAPLLWYLTVIKVGLRIWVLPLIPALVYWIYGVYKGYAKRKPDKEKLFVLLWVISVFAFFSWAKSKLIWYIIPIYPALVLVISGFVEAFYSFFIHKLPMLRRLPTSAFLAFSVTLAGAVYLFSQKERVFPPDYTRDEVALIQIRDQLDKRNNIMFLLPGFASPVPRYYNEGPVREVTKEELPELLRNNEQVHFIIDYGTYKQLKEQLALDNISLRLIGSVPSEADLVLIERVVIGIE